MRKTRIVVISGPTGIGKTELSIHLAEKFGGEIVGADSMQIYRYMDIGTAKPTNSERARVKHHMINVADPDEPYDAARYLREAREAVADIENRGSLPIVVGGTGFYIKALLYGLCEAKPEDLSVRQILWRDAETLGGEALHRRLAACDPETAGRIHPNDIYRVVRALEIYEITGRPMSVYRAAHRFLDAPYHALKLALYMDRGELYKRINQRVDLMVEQGLVGEVRDLLQKGYGRELKAMQALGYRHVLDYLEAITDREKAVEILKRDTRRYAKRQLTWFRSDPEIIWVKPDQEAWISRRIDEFLKSSGP
ncbi:MAG: tRNA (adenosine(37)-N6)-dimethylallyltransferase MiaA [Desulfobacteraceae bacterium]|nr:tRNA (adenosine(37)-N6)-dimethylallyltransferase MiaA [Desulfobacteraceae bacterium]MCF8093832.1 tRNA (adenosine(37)-N6)-dimethylallyltransferase MiaA [Desulfobacteraceae bacterium]